MQDRTIVHLNVADFAVAVEKVLDSSLRRRPVIVAASHTARALVYDMSEEAYREGIRKGMLLRLARRRSRRAVVLPPRPDHYQRAMAAFFKQAASYSPLVEPSGEGHLFLDLTGTHRLFGPPQDVASRLRRLVRQDLRLDPIWAVAPNKLLAKVASRLVKPAGEYLVTETPADFLAPLPLSLLPGLTGNDIIRLRELNLQRIGEVAALLPAQLAVPFGSRARHLYQLAHGIDHAPVAPPRERRLKIAVQHLFAEDTHEQAAVENTLLHLAEQAGARLRRQGAGARRAGVALDYTDGGRVVRQATSRTPLLDNQGLCRLALTALQRAWQRRVRIRRLELIYDRLASPAAQLSLFAAAETSRRSQEDLSRAMDRIRERFGAEMVVRGRMTGPDDRAG